MANAGPVYDSEDERRARLNEDDADEQEAEQDAQDQEDQPSLADQEADESMQEIMDDDDFNLVEKEALVYADKVGRGYVDKPRDIGVLRRQLGKRRNRIFLIGGSVTGAIIIAMVIFFSLLPFRIFTVVNALQNHFFASSNSIVDKESNVLFSNYVRKYVLPAFKQCRNNTIDRTCNPAQGKSLVAQLYRGWRDARIEDKLATNYGMEFKVGKSGHFYLHMNGMDGDGFDLGDENSGFITSTKSFDDYILNEDLKNSGNDKQFTKVTRAQLRAQINTALTNETNGKGVLYRYKVGRFMERKYGLKKCIFKCDTRDNFADWKDNKFRAGKMIIAERVIVPRSETLGIIIQCVLDDSCDPSRNDSTDENGRKTSQVQKDLQQKLVELRLLNDGRYATILAHSDGILKDGYAKYIAKQVAGALVSKAGAGDATKLATEKAAGNFLPVVGWVNSAASTIGTLEKVPGKLKALNFALNGSAMAAAYGAYRVYADECKSGNCDAEISGAMSDTLNAGNADSAGGPASAEQSPIYGSLINGSSSSNTVTSSLYGGNAYAAGTDSAVICNDGKPPAVAGQVCPEVKLGGSDSPISNAIDDILSSLHSLKTLADYWNNSVGAVAKKVIGAFGTLTAPLIQALGEFTHLNDLITAVTGPLFEAFTKLVIQDPFSGHGSGQTTASSASSPGIVGQVSKLFGGKALATEPDPTAGIDQAVNIGGGRMFEILAGGADVTAQSFAQETLGAKKITAVQAAEIRNEQSQQELLAYKNQPLMKRLFDKNSQYSLTSKLALAVPDSAKTATSNITTALLSNPFKVFAGMFRPALSFNQAQAAIATDDPFGVPQYGYPNDDPALAEANKDPETYWENNCTTDGFNIDWSKPVNANWQDNTAVDPDTGTPEYTTTNPCLLIQAAVGAAGAKYDDSLLTKDDNAGTPASTAAPSPDSTGSFTINNSAAQQAAQQAGSGVKVGYAIYDSSGNQQGSYNATFENYGASITKSIILVAYLNQLGTTPVSSTAKGYLTNMIENSDNDSANWVYKQLKNPAASVKTVASNAGMKGFKFDTSDKVYVLGQSQITADDFARFFAQIDTMLPSANRSLALNLLSNISPNVGLLQAGLPGTVYSKEGWKTEPDATTNPFGKEGSPWVVNQAAQFTSDGKTYGVAVTVSGAASQTAGEAVVQKVVTALIGP